VVNFFSSYFFGYDVCLTLPELCASAGFVGQKSKHLVNGNDTQVPNQEIGEQALG